MIVLACAALAACGSSNNNPADAQQTIDAPKPPIDAMPPGPPDASCFNNPTTHYEIINACTNAQFVDKTPNLPLLLPDGGLPPLP
jgi:hypothetical protein